MARKKKPVALSSALVVTQANQLVEARYTLPLGEQRLVLAMIADIEPGDEDLKEYCISIAQLAEFMGVRPDSMYQECQKITKKLLSRVLEIQEPGRLLQTNWVSSAQYIEGEGCVRLCFDPELKPYLLQLKSRFTSCKLNMLLSFKSMYTMRIYTLLKQYEGIGERQFELSELRNTLGLRPEQYKLFAHFRTRILEPAQQEMKAKADLYFDFDPVKQGRRLIGIHFTIHQQAIPEVRNRLEEQQQAAAEDSELAELLLQIPEAHRQKKTVHTALQRFLKSQGRAYVLRNIGYTNQHATTSYAGYLNRCLKEDWGCDWSPEALLAEVEPRIAGIPREAIRRQARLGESWEEATARMLRARMSER